MSTQHPDEHLWNEIVQDDELDRFFDDSEASLVARAERSVRGTSASWYGPAALGLAIGLLVTASAAWLMSTSNEPRSALVTSAEAPPFVYEKVVGVANGPAVEQTPSSAPSRTQELHETHATATSTSNRSALIEQADSLQRVVASSSDTQLHPGMLYTIGVLRKRAGQMKSARKALLQAEELATTYNITALLEKIHREQATLPSR